jgi:RNA polymerase sigma factor (sigma-70 family)
VATTRELETGRKCYVIRVSWTRKEDGPVSGDTTADVRDLIEQLRNGDDSARGALLQRVHHRLRRIAAAVFRKEFPRLRSRHELNSVVDEAWAGVMQALETTHPDSAEQFYGLIFHRVRQVLLEMARSQTRRDGRFAQMPQDEGESAAAPPSGAEDTTQDPAALVFWTDVHREVEGLPPDQRMVFDLHYFAEIPQAEIARLLDLRPKQVSRLWLSATLHLAERLEGIGDLL